LFKTQLNAKYNPLCLEKQEWKGETVFWEPVCHTDGVGVNSLAWVRNEAHLGGGTAQMEFGKEYGCL